MHVGSSPGHVVIPRDFHAGRMSHSPISFHCSGHKHYTPCWVLNRERQRALTSQGWSHVRDCCCYCYDIIWARLDKQFIKTPWPTYTVFSTSNKSKFLIMRESVSKILRSKWWRVSSVSWQINPAPMHKCSMICHAQIRAYSSQCSQRKS